MMKRLSILVFIVVVGLSAGCLGLGSQDKAQLERNIITLQEAENMESVASLMASTITTDYTRKENGEIVYQQHQSFKRDDFTRFLDMLEKLGLDFKKLIQEKDGERVITVSGNRGEAVRIWEKKMEIVWDNETIINRSIITTIRTTWAKVDGNWIFDGINVTVEHIDR